MGETGFAGIYKKKAGTSSSVPAFRPGAGNSLLGRQDAWLTNQDQGAPEKAALRRGQAPYQMSRPGACANTVCAANLPDEERLSVVCGDGLRASKHILTVYRAGNRSRQGRSHSNDPRLIWPHQKTDRMHSQAAS
jgi:hypothetical protein